MSLTSPRAACVAAALFLLGPGLAAPPPSPKQPVAEGPNGWPKLTAKSAILVDAASGQVLWQQAADEVRFPASLTKMMTALLILEQGNLNDTVVVSPRAASTGESSAHLEAGDRVSLRDLLVAVLLPSANDASVAAAEHVGGSLEAFVERMNARAPELGLTATHFMNPSGLPAPRHVSSARDLARLACAAMKLPTFRELVRLDRAEITRRPAGGKAPPRTGKLENHNRLVLRRNGRYWPLADGVKTGYTHEAGRCLVASATKDGWQLLCVVLGCTDSWTDSRRLLEWGFADFRRERAVTAGQTTARVHVIDGSPPEVVAVAKSSIDAVLPLQAPPAVARVSESYPTAPVPPGAEVGELVVSGLDGTEMRATLVTMQPVRRSLIARIRDHWGIVVASILALALLGALVVHGAVAKAAGARRRGVATDVRGDDQGGPRNGRRRGRAAPGPPG